MAQGSRLSYSKSKVWRRGSKRGMAENSGNEKVAGQDKGRGSRNHALVVDQILVRCGSRADCRLWKNSTGVAQSFDSGRIIRFGLKGSADILGIGRGGVLIAIEVKTGSARQSVYQARFEKMIRRFGGLYTVVSSADEAEKWLDSRRLLPE